MNLKQNFLLEVAREAGKILVSRATYSLVRAWCRDELHVGADSKAFVTDRKGMKVPIQCTDGTKHIPEGLIVGYHPARRLHRWFPTFGDDSIHVGDYEKCDKCVVVIIMNQ